MTKGMNDGMTEQRNDQGRSEKGRNREMQHPLSLSLVYQIQGQSCKTKPTAPPIRKNTTNNSPRIQAIRSYPHQPRVPIFQRAIPYDRTSEAEVNSRSSYYGLNSHPLEWDTPLALLDVNLPKSVIFSTLPSSTRMLRHAKSRWTMSVLLDNMHTTLASYRSGVMCMYSSLIVD